VVHDVSVRGVGLEVRESLISIFDTVVVDLQVRNVDIPGVVLQGSVRYVQPDGQGASRVGIEFTRATPLERWTLERLIQLQQRHPSRDLSALRSVTLEGPSVRLRCVACDLVLGVITPNGHESITAAFNRNPDDLAAHPRHDFGGLGDDFIIDTPHEYPSAWDLPAVPTAWCPQCTHKRTTTRDHLLGPIARTRATGVGEDVSTFE
jgi:hypothetical protein